MHEIESAGFLLSVIYVSKTNRNISIIIVVVFVIIIIIIIIIINAGVFTINMRAKWIYSQRGKY
jgi:hypothetical protein